MNAASHDPSPLSRTDIPQDKPWSAARWFVLIALVFGLHIGLIYSLGSRKPVERRLVKNQPAIRLDVRREEVRQLDDPTLFATPHPQGFAANTWLKIPQMTFASFRWTEPPRLFVLPVQRLGETFLHRATPPSLPFAAKSILPTAQATTLQPIESFSVNASESQVYVNTGLRERKILNTPINLPAWSAAEPLTNTVVRVWVDSRGKAFSPSLQRPGSGSKEADQLALKVAQESRFTPDRSQGNKLIDGTLIFEWLTITKTNTPATTP